MASPLDQAFYSSEASDWFPVVVNEAGVASYCLHVVAGDQACAVGNSVWEDCCCCVVVRTRASSAPGLNFVGHPEVVDLQRYSNFQAKAFL